LGSPFGTSTVPDVGLDSASATARRATASEVRDAIGAVGAKGEFWAKRGDSFFFTSSDSGVQVGEVEVQPELWAGDWDEPIDAVSFRKPRDAIEAPRSFKASP